LSVTNPFLRINAKKEKKNDQRKQNTTGDTKKKRGKDATVSGNPHYATYSSLTVSH